jgi:hypothetical protein
VRIADMRMIAASTAPVEIGIPNISLTTSRNSRRESRYIPASTPMCVRSRGADVDHNTPAGMEVSTGASATEQPIAPARHTRSRPPGGTQWR